MKCDELKRYSLDVDYEEQAIALPDDKGIYIDASEVDAAIDELKAVHHKERHEYINMVAELKQKLEDVQATAYAESVDAGMRERRLKRALWLARAERAKECKYKYETWERHEERNVYKDYDMIAIVGYKGRTWSKVERKCRAKAKEYL